MPSAISLHFREQILRRVFLQQAISPNAYLALTRTVPEANSTGTRLNEPPGNFGYSRKSYALGIGRWEIGSYSDVRNTQEISFGTPTGDWGLIQGWALTTAATGGLLIASGSVVLPERLGFGTPVTVKAGSLRFSLGDASA